jgi:hypothetical protein
MTHAPRARSRCCAVGAALACLLLGGCSTYDGRYLYEPKPVVVDVAAPRSDDAAAARTMVTVIGVRRGNDAEAVPRTVELRVRIENSGDHAVRFDPETLRLVSGDLRDFGPPRLHPDAPTDVAPGAPVLVSALFPLPSADDGGPPDMEGLHAAWVVAIDGEDVPVRAAFTRVRPVYYGSYGYDPWWPYGPYCDRYYGYRYPYPYRRRVYCR